jgi:hypothetical protein
MNISHYLARFPLILALLPNQNMQHHDLQYI